jgi:hypothetical protein
MVSAYSIYLCKKYELKANTHPGLRNVETLLSQNDDALLEPLLISFAAAASLKSNVSKIAEAFTYTSRTLGLPSEAAT